MDFFDHERWHQSLGPAPPDFKPVQIPEPACVVQGRGYFKASLWARLIATLFNAIGDSGRFLVTDIGIAALARLPLAAFQVFAKRLGKSLVAGMRAGTGLVW